MPSSSTATSRVAHRGSAGRLRLALGAAALLAAAWPLAAPLAAQVVPARRVDLENDFFDFRLTSWKRPDDNYTHGTRVTGGALRAMGWGRLAGNPTPCGLEDRTDRDAGACASTILESGQLMFTPTVDNPTPLPDQRAYAGWLYTRMDARLESRRRLRSATLTGGVTGPPSLAEATHRGFHFVKPHARVPLGWAHQLPTEVAAAAGYGERLLAADVRLPGGVRVADLVPDWSLQLGTLRTSAAAGARARVGWNVSHPWRGAAAGAGAWELYALAGARGELVLHDLFLDGSTWARSPRVDRTPVVTQLEVGAGLRARRLALEYRLVTQGREYRTGPARHPYGALSVSLLRSPRPGY